MTFYPPRQVLCDVCHQAVREFPSDFDWSEVKAALRQDGWLVFGGQMSTCPDCMREGAKS